MDAYQKCQQGLFSCQYVRLEHKIVSLCWLMVWRYILVKKLDEKTNYITDLIAVNAVLIFLEFVYSCEWHTGLIKGAVLT